MAKFTKEDYLAERKEGLSQKQMAERHGVCEAYVSKVKKQCEGQVRDATPPVIQAEVLSRQHDALDKLMQLADQANSLAVIFQGILDNAPGARAKMANFAGRKGFMGADLLKCYIALLGELRKQLEADNTIKRTKFDIERVMRFQETVMQVLQECDPALAQKVVTRLAAMDATVSALDFGIGAAAETL